MIFFSDAYQKSGNCRLEAESAKRNDKTMIFVKMQKNKCTIEPWFEPIISNSIYIDYFKFGDDTCNEIQRHIAQTVGGDSSGDDDSNEQSAAPDDQKKDQNQGLSRIEKRQSRKRLNGQRISKASTSQ